MSSTSSSPRIKGRREEEPISTVATQIVQMAVRDDVSLQDLGRLAESDPAFAMRVLALVNSPAFGLANATKDVKQAVQLLGIRGLRNLALSLCLSDMVPFGESGEVLLGISLRRAVVARMIAESLGEKRTDEFFTAGLFLESGLLARARVDLDGAANIARLPAMSRVTIERAKGEKDHPTRGAEVAKGYQLSDETVSAIAHHHDPDPPDERLPRIAWATERVAAAFEGGDLTRNQTEAVRALAALGIDQVRAEKLINEIPEKVAASASAFDRQAGAQPNLESLMRDANSALVALNENYEDIIRTLNRLVKEKEELTDKLKEANSRLERLASTDGLTELLNKRSFLDALKRDLARADRQQQWVTLIISDIDHFKKVNDTYGHQTGDDVLKMVAKIYRDTLRTGDVPARYGGEEFVVILPNTDPAGALIVAERIRQVIESTPAHGSQGTFQVTSSFGVASAKGPGCAAKGDALIARADELLYESKRGGRNRVTQDVNPLK